MTWIKTLMATIDRSPDAWVRLGVAVPDGKSLALIFNMFQGKAGPIVHRCRVRCVGMREYHLEALDGGRLRLYDSRHPLARQYSAPRARIKVTRLAESAAVLAALVQVHSRTFGDWVPLDRYLGTLADFPRRVAADGLAVSGPDFLLRSYAKALRQLGVSVSFQEYPRRRQPVRTRVLHFSQSFVVAEAFRAEILNEDE
jgi:hypothetical protein